MGPFYLKNSSTAQNLMACGVGGMFAGRGAADVLNEASNLVRSAQSGTGERAPGQADDFVDRMTRLARFAQSQTRVPQTMINYAEIYIYEPILFEDGYTEWRLIASHTFDRHFFSPEFDNHSVDLLQSIIERQAPAELGPHGETTPDKSPADPANLDSPAAPDNGEIPHTLSPTIYPVPRPDANPQPRDFPRNRGASGAQFDRT
jgi:hypothetical protein